MSIGLTLFTTCKPFTGRAAIIQRNALRSWQRLCPPCEVLVFGNESGVEQICTELGFHHFPDCTRNQFGTPLINNLFEQAERNAGCDYLAYVNADIMLAADVVTAAQSVRGYFDKFLLLARRWNVDIDGEWNLPATDWDDELYRYAVGHGALEPPEGDADLFIYRRGVLGRLPPLAVGRSRCDSMLISQAARLGVPVIDGTDVLTSLHQNHDYSHVAGTSQERFKGPESVINEQLLEFESFVLTPRDAAYRLTRSGLESNINRNR